MTGAQYIRAYPRTAHRSWKTLVDRTAAVQAPNVNHLYLTFFRHPRIRFDRLILPLNVLSVAVFDVPVAVYDPRDRSRILYAELSTTGAAERQMIEALFTGGVRERRPGWLALAVKFPNSNVRPYAAGDTRQGRDIFCDLPDAHDWSLVTLKRIVGAAGLEALDAFAGTRVDADMVMPATLPGWDELSGTMSGLTLALLIDGPGWEDQVDGLV